MEAVVFHAAAAACYGLAATLLLIGGIGTRRWLTLERQQGLAPDTVVGVRASAAVIGLGLTLFCCAVFLTFA